jgi:NitT/TauT family transport system substrate-binding protein
LRQGHFAIANAIANHLSLHLLMGPLTVRRFDPAGRIGALALAFVLALVLACSGKKTEQEPPAPAGSAGAAKAGSAGASSVASGREYQIAWALWTGYMPFKLMEAKGLLARRAAEHGIKVKLVELPAYMDAVTAFSTGKVDGCAMTVTEILQPIAAGIEAAAILIYDTSEGGDGVLVRGIDGLRGLRGKEILLPELSVSHYLLVRGLESVGLKESDVKIRNTDGDAAGKAFVADPKVLAVVSWNPHLFQATEAGKGKVIFSSKDIPGEIIDALVVNRRALAEAPQLGTVLVEAWYDAMRLIEDPATREESIAIMAEASHATADEFKKMLGGIRLFTNRAETAAFLEADATKATMEKIKQFLLSHGLVKDDGNFAIGYGAKATEKLRFDASYAAGR